MNTQKLQTLAARPRPRHSRGKNLPRLWLLTDQARTPDPLALIRTLPAGAGVIFRHYDAPDRPALAVRVAEHCRARRLVLLIGGDWRLACRVKAQGVHWPERALLRGAHLRKPRPGFLLTASAHGWAALKLAERRGVDAALLSPVFFTPSHPEAATLGALKFAALARLTKLPVIALGGIGEKNFNRITGTGAAGIAGIGIFSNPRT